MYVLDPRTNSKLIYQIQILIFGFIVLTAASAANAGNLKLTWSASPSPEVSGYKIYYGETSEQYTNNVDVGDTTNYTLAGVEPGKRYYLAATAYCSNCNGFQESDFSNELEVVVPVRDDSNTSKVISQADWRLVYVDSEELTGEDGRGVNAFDGDPSTVWATEWSQRIAPLPHEIQIDLGAVYELESFRYLPVSDENPYGRIKDYAFYVSGDGQSWGDPVAAGSFPNSAAEQEVAFGSPATGQFIRLVALSEVHEGPWTAVAEINVVGTPLSANLLSTEISEASAGKMAITVGDSGSIGSINESGNAKSAYTEDDPTLLPSVEIGEVLAAHEWVKVNFQQNFADPVVVAPSFSYTHQAPGVIRIRNITSDGFELRIQSWDSLDGERPAEQVHFMAMERGHYTLPNGTRIEAGTIEMEANYAFETIHFLETFSVSPVLLASVTSDNGFQAVAVRKQEISTEGVRLGLYGQEAEGAGLETIDYIAAEPSLGTAGAIPFEVGRTEEIISGDFQKISLRNTYTKAPIVLFDLQTGHGSEPVSLRWDSKTAQSILVKADGARAMEEETQSAFEIGGYIAFGLDD